MRSDEIRLMCKRKHILIKQSIADCVNSVSSRSKHKYPLDKGG